MAASAGYIVAPMTTGKVALAAFLVGVFVGYHLKGTISRGVERLLRRKNLLCGDFHPQISTGNHNPVFYYLGDNLNCPGMRAKKLANVDKIRSLSYKGSRNEINLVRDSPLQNVILVLLMGKSTMTPGRLTFFRSPSIAVFSHLHRTVPFSSSQAKTLRPLVAHGDQLIITLNAVICGNGDLLIALKLDGLPILQHSRSAHNLCGHHRLAESVERLLVVLVRAVREVEASHIHSGAQELLEDGNIAGLGPEGADDLGLGDCLR
eukprot:SM000163S02315  [mRNA]  locus=s163:173659:177937:+ [translate_table: standard]